MYLLLKSKEISVSVFNNLVLFTTRLLYYIKVFTLHLQLLEASTWEQVMLKFSQHSSRLLIKRLTWLEHLASSTQLIIISALNSSSLLLSSPVLRLDAALKIIFFYINKSWPHSAWGSKRLWMRRVVTQQSSNSNGFYTVHMDHWKVSISVL